MPWPADRIVFAELQILGSIGSPVPDYPPLLNLIARGLLRPADLITRTVTLDDAAAISQRCPTTR